MSKLSKGIFNVLNIIVAVALVVLFVVSADMWRKVQYTNEQIIYVCILGASVLLSVGICLLKIKTTYKVLGILLIAFIIRLLWTITVKSVPVSDFLTIYQSATGFLNGDVSPFRDYGYLARFPHLVPMAVYMIVMMKVFGAYHVIAMKCVALALSVLTVYEVYVLSGYYVKKESSKLVALILATVYPSFITYSSTYCTETIGVPLFLLSVILFHKAVNSEKHRLLHFAICGAVLYCSNMFRGVAVIFLIAFGLYLLLMVNQNKWTGILAILSGYVAVCVLASSVLLVTGVIGQPLWKSAEPSFATLMLKGHNFESGGHWNLEDAQFVDKNLRSENLSQLCFEKVKERLSQKSLPEIAQFYGEKFVAQWSVGDCSGMYWATMNTDAPYVYPTARPFQLIYTVVLLVSLLACFAKEKHPPMLLMMLLLCGFGAVFIVLETQSRYSYVVHWVFIILASYGVDYFIRKRPAALMKQTDFGDMI